MAGTIPKVGSIRKCAAGGLEWRLCCIVKTGAFGLRLAALGGCSASVENFMLCCNDTFLLGAEAASEPIII
jgi:hypothetical protein